jgi:diguanylate cyclase (GGDEF)-like protein
VPEAVADHPDPASEAPPLRLGNRLLDRDTFFDHLRRAMARNEGVGGDLALLVMALDPFVVADASGAWSMHDEVCMVTAGRVIGCLHHSHVTARIAGDEYLVLAEGAGGVGGAVEVSEQILMAVRWPDPHLFEGESVTASIGIALQESRMAAEQLLINADLAMYAAKSDGGNRYQVFEPSVRDAAMTTPLVG